MRNLDFKYAKAVNFLCFGSSGVELDFKKYGNIVLIKARNLDVQDDDKNASNGCGKTALANIIVYGLFGKTVTKPKKLDHGDLVNHKSGEKLCVEVQWDDYRVVRKRNPDSLHFWQSTDGIWDKDTKISKGGSPAIQKQIEAALGLNYETFVNLCVFADDPTNYFLECDKPTKRIIVENLLSLDKYRVFFDKAKDLTKDLKESIKILTSDYAKLMIDLEDSRNRLSKVTDQEEQWRENKRVELQRLLKALQSKRDELDAAGGTGLAEWNEAQERIALLASSLAKDQEQKIKLEEILQQATPKLTQKLEEEQNLAKQVRSLGETVELLEKNIRINQKVVDDNNNKISFADCPWCLGKVEKSRFSNIVDKAIEEISVAKNKLLEVPFKQTKEQWEVIKVELGKIQKAFNDCKNKINCLNKAINVGQADVASLLRVEKPDVGNEVVKINEQMEELKRQIEEKQLEIDGTSPFLTIKEAASQECLVKNKEVNAKKEELSGAEAELPYYDFWVKAFGDAGIRKVVVDGIVPALNSRIAYWLQYLIDNKIKLEFDNELKETIDRYPFLKRPYVYHGMSGGQRRRLNLSVQQAFAFIMELNCGTSPSIVFLDEISMNMDEVGVDCLYRMICQLATEKQVFVIDHNPVLLQLLDNADKIQLEMKDEVTTIV